LRVGRIWAGGPFRPPDPFGVAEAGNADFDGGPAQRAGRLQPRAEAHRPMPWATGPQPCGLKGRENQNGKLSRRRQKLSRPFRPQGLIAFLPSAGPLGRWDGSVPRLLRDGPGSERLAEARFRLGHQLSKPEARRQQLVHQGILFVGIQRQNGQQALIGQLHHKSLAGPCALVKSLLQVRRRRPAKADGVGRSAGRLRKRLRDRKRLTLDKRLTQPKRLPRVGSGKPGSLSSPGSVRHEETDGGAHEVRRFCGQTDDPHRPGGGQDDETDGRNQGAGASNEHWDGRADRTGASARHPDGPSDQADASIQHADGPGKLTDAGGQVPGGRRGRPDGSNQKTDAGIHLTGASVDETGGRARLRKRPFRGLQRSEGGTGRPNRGPGGMPWRVSLNV